MRKKIRRNRERQRTVREDDNGIWKEREEMEESESKERNCERGKEGME